MLKFLIQTLYSVYAALLCGLFWLAGYWLFDHSHIAGWVFFVGWAVYMSCHSPCIEEEKEHAG